MAKRKEDLPPGMSRPTSSRKPEVAKSKLLGTGAVKPAQSKTNNELLLVCIQDPFDGIGTENTLISETNLPASDSNSNHQWQMRAVLEMNPFRFYESWATRGSFVLDLTVRATVAPKSGTWGGNVDTLTQSGTCRIMVMRELGDKIRISLDSGCTRAPEKPLAAPDVGRFLNADISFQVGTTSSIRVCASAIISNKNWSRLIAGSQATIKGLAFDGTWRSNLEAGDGDTVSQGQWAFALMTESDYQRLCDHNRWSPMILPSNQ